MLLWYVYSMMLTYVYMSVLIQKMTQTKYTGTVETLPDILDNGLTPMFYHRSSLISDLASSRDPVKRC